MSFPANENLADTKPFNKHKCVLDLTQFPSVITEIEQIFSVNVIPNFSANWLNGLKARVNMVEEALANISLSFKRQETPKSILIVEKGILKLVQHQGGEEDDQEMHQRGLRTSLIVDSVNGGFDLPTECVKYILVRDKYPQQLSSLVGKELPNVNCRSSHLSVYNRLEGWRVETRKRPDDTHDKFYHHASSGRMFRSLVEVEKFIKYGLYPSKPR